MERTVAQSLIHSSHTPAHLDRLCFQPLTSTFSVTSCHWQARERANGDMWPTDSSFFFFLSSFLLHALRHSCCSSENTVSRGMSKHAWPSFPCEPVRQDTPPHHRPQPADQPTKLARPPASSRPIIHPQQLSELVGQQTLKLALCDLSEVF